MPKKKECPSKAYTYLMHCCFEFQNTFSDSELETDTSGRAGDTSPTDEALKELEDEMLELLFNNYSVDKIELSYLQDSSNPTKQIDCSFRFSNSFKKNEVEQDPEGGEDDFSPTQEAMTAFEDEFKELLKLYQITSIQVFGDFDDLLGIDDDPPAWSA